MSVDTGILNLLPMAKRTDKIKMTLTSDNHVQLGFQLDLEFHDMHNE